MSERYDNDPAYLAALRPVRRQPVQALEPSRYYDGEFDLVLGDEHMTHRTAMTGADLDALRDLLAEAAVPRG